MNDCKTCKWYIGGNSETCGFGTYEFLDNGTTRFRVRNMGFVDGCTEYYSRNQYMEDIKDPKAYFDKQGYKNC